MEQSLLTIEEKIKKEFIEDMAKWIAMSINKESENKWLVIV